MACVYDIGLDPNWSDPEAPEFQKPFNLEISCGAGCSCKGLGEFIDVPPLAETPPLETNVVISRLSR